MENNKEFYRLTCYGLLLLSAVINFTLFMTMCVAAMITLFFIAPSIDLSEDYARMMRTPISQDYSETGWKIGVLVMMFISLVHVLYKPMATLLGE